jgi:hypothetical protein
LLDQNSRNITRRIADRSSLSLTLIKIVIDVNCEMDVLPVSRC